MSGNSGNSAIGGLTMAFALASAIFVIILGWAIVQDRALVQLLAVTIAVAVVLVAAGFALFAGSVFYTRRQDDAEYRRVLAQTMALTGTTNRVMRESAQASAPMFGFGAAQLPQGQAGGSYIDQAAAADLVDVQ